MAAFDGTSCPEEHLMAYKYLMMLYTTNPTLWCKFFPISLTGVALTWYTSLPVGSIHTFAQLESKFLSHFVASRRQEKIKFPLAQHNAIRRGIHIVIFEEIPWGGAGSNGFRGISLLKRPDQTNEGSKVEVPVGRKSSEDIRGSHEIVSKLCHGLWNMSSTWPQKAKVREEGSNILPSILKEQTGILIKEG